MCLPNVARAVVTYNVLSFGAKGDGVRDSTGPFLKAWASACSSTQSTTIYVPKGRYLLKNVEFRGPCKSKIKVQIDGTLVAPLDYNAVGKSRSWILFIKVNRVGVVGGTLDAKGFSFWSCHKSRSNCPVVDNVQLGERHCDKRLNIDKQPANVKIIAPDDSPNTDDIHVQGSTDVTIKGCNIRTVDDCVSIGPGTSGLRMERIQCGPGHGVSIGSLAREYNEAGVENVTLINSDFIGSDNGLRIKSWARPSTGFLKKILFQNIVMKNVENPIIIDQNYCPNKLNCGGKTSGVKISDVTYKNIVGTSATKVAVTFDCSPTTPCTSIMLQDVKLNYHNNTPQSLCDEEELHSFVLVTIPPRSSATWKKSQPKVQYDELQLALLECVASLPPAQHSPAHPPTEQPSSHPSQSPALPLVLPTPSTDSTTSNTVSTTIGVGLPVCSIRSRHAVAEATLSGT
ncbi:hypothetical protein LguiA_029582 [Lonicera macranthoides]